MFYGKVLIRGLSKADACYLHAAPKGSLHTGLLLKGNNYFNTAVIS